MRAFNKNYFLTLLSAIVLMFAFGCDDNNSSTVPPVDDEKLTIDIQVTDITAYSAMLTLTPSTDDTYACVFIAATQMPDFESDEEAIAFIIEYFDPATYNGEYSEPLQPLMPSTDYMVIAFGLEGETPTTEMFTYSFTSLVAEEGVVEIENIELLKLFDVAEIAAIDAAYENLIGVCECIAVVKTTTSVPCDKLYFWWYEEWMMVEYTEEAFYEDLLMYDYANNPELMDMYYSLDESDRFFFAGLVEDNDGNLSDLYVGDCFTLSEDMCSPAEEFLDLVKVDTSAVVMLLGR